MTNHGGLTINRTIKYMGNLQWKPIITLPRYYVDKDYAGWCHNIRGAVLEIGGGRLSRYTKESTTLDISRNFEPDILATGCSLPFKDNVFDTIVSIEVLEHLEKPQSVVNEIHRVLRPGGIFFLAVPFIHEIHGEDYFRYAKLSIVTMFKKFTVVNIEEQGSIMSVLSNLAVSFFRSPLLWNIFSLFYPLIAKMDRHRSKRFTLGYSVYGEK